MADNQKQIVQWFPGHMAKTRRLIKESLSLVDGVTEIIDARIPYSSSNPELEELINNKPRIVLLNKCDLADKNTTNQWVEHYKKKGVKAIPVDCRTGKGLNNYIVAVREVLKDVIKKNTITLIRSAILQYEKDNKVELDENGIIEIISKELKKRNDSFSIKSFRKWYIKYI